MTSGATWQPSYELTSSINLALQRICIGINLKNMPKYTSLPPCLFLPLSSLQLSSLTCFLCNTFAARLTLVVASRFRFGPIQALAGCNWIRFQPLGRVGSDPIPTSGSAVSSGAYGGETEGYRMRRALDG